MSTALSAAAGIANSAWSSAFARLVELPHSLKQSYATSDAIKVVEVSHKYLPPNPPNVSCARPLSAGRG